MSDPHTCDLRPETVRINAEAVAKRQRDLAARDEALASAQPAETGQRPAEQGNERLDIALIAQPTEVAGDDMRGLSYQQIFNAIAAATRVHDGYVSISVSAFREAIEPAILALGAPQVDAALERAEEGRSTARELDDQPKSAPDALDRLILNEAWETFGGNHQTGDFYFEFAAAVAFARPRIEAAALERAAEVVEKAAWAKTVYGLAVAERIAADIRALKPATPTRTFTEADVAAARAEERERYAKPTEAMATAAAEAHYGKRRVKASGGIHGITMTVDDQDYTFWMAFKRMWPAAIRALPASDVASGREGGR